MPEPAESKALKGFGRLLGATILVGAALIAWRVTHVTFHYPRTDDAEVRANLIGIAPHVGGPVIELPVVDNQEVKEGDLLFVIDPRPYQAALAAAQSDLLLARSELGAMSNAVASAVAEVNVRQAQLEQANDVIRRYEPLLKDAAIEALTVDTARTAQRTAVAQLEEARQSLMRQQNLLGQYGTLNARIASADSAVTAAQLNVDYCRVHAPFNGRVANLNIAVGHYAQVGQPLFGLVDTRHWYVIANFRETYLNSIQIGAETDVFLTAYPRHTFRGVVQGVGWAVQTEDMLSGGILAAPRPDLNWVRLAQRIPVRIEMQGTDPQRPFRMGLSAVVTVRPTLAGSAGGPPASAKQ